MDIFFIFLKLCWKFGTVKRKCCAWNTVQNKWVTITRITTEIALPVQKSQLLQVSLRRNTVGSGMILLSMWVLHSSQVVEVAWQRTDTTFLFLFFCNCFQRPQGTGATEDPFDGLHQPVLGHRGCGWFLQLCRKGQDASPQVSVCPLACLRPIHPSVCLSVHPSVWCHVCWGRRCKCGVQWGSLSVCSSICLLPCVLREAL